MNIAKRKNINIGAINILNRDKVLSNYFMDISKYKPLSKEIENALFLQIKNGSYIAREKIVNHNQRFIVSIAKLYNKGNILPDLISEGNIGLLEAIDKFDPTLGYKFISFAVHYIHRNIFKFAYNNKIIKQTNKHSTYIRINKIQNIFFLENGRLPSNDEVIDIFYKKYSIKIDEDSILKLNILEMDRDFNNYDNDNITIDKLSTNINNINDIINKDYYKSYCNNLLNKLDKKEKYIIESLYGINDEFGYEQTLDNIATTMNYSKERVRQIKINSINKLKKNIVK